MIATRHAAALSVLTFVSATSPSCVIRAQIVTPGWDNGLTIQSADGDYKLQIGGLIQMDGRFDVDDPDGAVVDTFVLRRVRPILQGRVARYFDFRIMPDFGNGTAVLFDAFFDTRFSNALRLRVGKDKTPIGLEQLQSDYAVLFPERTLVTNLVPNRDIGIQAQGDVAHGFVSYVAGVFNGVPDGTNGDLDTNGSKDVVGRVTVRPLAASPRLGTLGLAVAASSGSEAGALPSYRSSAQQTFFGYAAGAAADGRRTRVSPAAFYYYKAFGAFSEYARTTQAVRRGEARADVRNAGWEVTGSIVATGERASDRGVTPQRPFDPKAGQWGALQLIARYSTLGADPRAFALGLAGTGSSQRASAVGVGASWYLNGNVKQVLTYERTRFDQTVRPPEHAIIFRMQLNLQPSL